jgi:transglutaminase-like putative cysteine protease
MRFRAEHTTTYVYSEPVAICHNEVHLRPREEGRQLVASSELSVHPAPSHSTQRKDYFGNSVTHFSIDTPHQMLTVTAVSEVEVGPFEPPPAGMTPPWEAVRDEVRAHRQPDRLDAFQYLFDSPYVAAGPAFAAYAAASFPEGRPWLAGVVGLTHRIHREFRYDPLVTNVATPVGEVLRDRRGVCQDFAHVMVACLRSLGLPARYVSGYLRSSPRLVGAEASHAWVSAFCPGWGWIDADPTNGLLPSDGHLTLAWGRDYGDVTPVKGVALGGGEHVISVAVTVKSR